MRCVDLPREGPYVDDGAVRMREMSLPIGGRDWAGRGVVVCYGVVCYGVAWCGGGKLQTALPSPIRRDGWMQFAGVRDAFGARLAPMR